MEDLADFVVINEEKLNAVKAAIRAARKAGDINLDVLERQKRELEITTVQAQCRLGELTAGITTKPGERKDLRRDLAEVGQTKTEQLTSLGITHQRASEYERMAAHPEAVQKVIESGEAVTKAAILNEIQKPHVVNNSGDNEWYTPSEYIEAAREVMGSIDLDPASNDYANRTVKATEYYTKETDGLSKEWHGNIWMNPPYSADLIKRFAEKLVESEFQQAIVLVNNATDTGWFRTIINIASAVVFTTGRIRFVKPDFEKSAPLQGQAFIYCGDYADIFLDVFSRFGWGARL